ncbi:MAG: branched-chain amino acid ABC transporter permease [Microbacteriaceae bacterium]
MDWGAIFTNTAAWLIHPTTFAYALAAIGLSVHFGFAGLLNFGMAGFMALGAYGYAISILSFGLPWWVGIIIGCVAAVIFAMILGIPTLRLRADYLAIVTIAAAEIVRLLISSLLFEKWTNGDDGLGNYHAGFRDANPIPEGTYGFGPWVYNHNDWWIRIVGITFVALAALIVWAIMRSPWGRVLKGIREDEDAVRALGKNVFLYKLQALMIGGVFGALGGVVFALPSSVVPASYTTSFTFFIWTILLLGGAATVFGPIVGAVIFWVLMSFLGSFLPALANLGLLPMTDIQAGVLRFVLVGLGLMLIVIFRPQGIFGNKKELTFVK